MDTEAKKQLWDTYKASLRHLPESIKDICFVVLDTETTGFNYEKDRILSIGALKLKNGIIRVQDSFEVFLEQDTFDASTVKIHGIIKKGKITRISEAAAVFKLIEYLQGSVIVAHHTHFDVSMLNAALFRQGFPELLNSTLDTAHLYKKTLSSTAINKKNYTLDYLAESYGISKVDRHTALGDAYITAIAFLAMLNKLKPKTLKDLQKRKGLFGLGL
ncbi:PolC-type DNA polymerase III [Flavobacterium sp. ASW18X]|uniref:3'-5' exonuclease n=1 Tax=Flavobacterium sp. ASW18X TaxID=2572595 RepID=UPI0010ADCFB8|nr:3'-5' exonuclease [Flavobacterium sp. ASW18X]TKD66263.1 3'-5' exonuclease [Flavobacterium sp. ASW18X]